MRAITAFAVLLALAVAAQAKTLVETSRRFLLIFAAAGEEIVKGEVLASVLSVRGCSRTRALLPHARNTCLVCLH
jgi:hypothetical protein